MKTLFWLLVCTFTLSLSPSQCDQFIYFHDTTEKVSSESVGGKAANLLFLEKLPGIRVPKWFCVSAPAFQHYLRGNNLYPLINKLDELSENYTKNEEQILELGANIQQAILAGQMGGRLQKRIHTSYRKLKKSLGKRSIYVAVRSSGVLEDLAHSSFAGLYDSCLNRKGFDDVCTAIKQVWASTFNPRIVKERARTGIKQAHCLIAAIVQEMVHAKAAGVASSMELSTNYPGIEISANYGTGESVVGGEVSVDKWLIHPTQNYIIKTICGNKSVHNVPADRGRGTVQRHTEVSKQNELSLHNDEVLQIAHQAKTVRSYYDSEIDTEFAVAFDGSLYLLQARPIVKVAANTLMVVDPEDAKQHTKIATGDYSVPGVVHGRLKFIDKWEELANKTVQLDPDDIVVTYVAINYWSHYLTQFKGLITKQGGPTTHPILLCRERKVPCLIGIGDDFETLRKYSGKVVTLDGIGRVVYEGEVKLQEAQSSQLLKAFEPVEVRKWKDFSDRIFELKKGNYIFERDDKYWLTQPTYPLKRLFQEIHLKRAERLPVLINGHTEFKIETKIIENHVCSVIEPAEQYVHCFRDMTLDECELFCRNQEKNTQDFVNIAKDFKLDPTIWQKYVDALSDLRAYGWVAEIFRMYADRQAEIEASSLQMPQYYFDECSSHIQAQLIEEDTFMQKDIYELASKMQHLPDFQNYGELKQDLPQMFSEVEKLAMNYRFTQNAAIENELDLDIVYKRLTDEIGQIRRGKSFATMKKTVTGAYFPQNQSLYRWLSLSIYNRVLQSNAHHYVMRYQWNIRNELLKLGSYWTNLGRLKQAGDIFDLSTQEVRDLIIAWQEAGNV